MNDKNNDNRIDPASGDEDLSSLISSAIENKKSQDQGAKTWNDSPITDYDKAPKPRAEEPVKQAAPKQPQRRPGPNGQTPRRRPPQGAVPKRPPQGTKGRPVKSGQRPAQGQQNGQRPAQGQKNVQGQKNGQRPARPAQASQAKNAANQSRRRPGQRPPVKPEPKKVPAAVETPKTDITAGEGENPKKAKWSKKKKTGVALAIIFIVFFLLVGFIVFMFFHYTGLLDRNTSEAKNYSKPTLDSSEFVDESDTFDTLVF